MNAPCSDPHIALISPHILSHENFWYCIGGLFTEDEKEMKKIFLVRTDYKKIQDVQESEEISRNISPFINRLHLLHLNHTLLLSLLLLLLVPLTVPLKPFLSFCLFFFSFFSNFLRFVKIYHSLLSP